MLVCLIEKGEGEKGSGLCSGGTVGGDLGETGLGNLVFAKDWGGDFVKAWVVLSPSPWLVGIPGVVVCTSTDLLVVPPTCVCPKSTRDMALTVVCLVVSV